MQDKIVQLVINGEGTIYSGDNSHDASNNKNDGNQVLFTTTEQKEKKQKEERTITRIFVIRFIEFFLLKKFSRGRCFY